MESEEGEEDPTKEDVKYWQELAGVRGARIHYLEQDIKGLLTRVSQQATEIDFLTARLDLAIKEIKEMARKRRCKSANEDLELF